MPKAKRRPVSAQTCKQIADLLVDYLTDNLRPKLKQEFARHLSLCPDCVSFVNTYRKTVQSTAALRSEKIPAKVRDNVLNFLRNKLRRVGAIIFYLIT
ncbi:MAG TPA: zf-HC2 domain-containing protein [Candidatus Binatia bacterium]